MATVGFFGDCNSGEGEESFSVNLSRVLPSVDTPFLKAGTWILSFTLTAYTGTAPPPWLGMAWVNLSLLNTPVPSIDFIGTACHFPAVTGDGTCPDDPDCVDGSLLYDPPYVAKWVAGASALPICDCNHYQFTASGGSCACPDTIIPLLSSYAYRFEMNVQGGWIGNVALNISGVWTGP